MGKIAEDEVEMRGNADDLRLLMKLKIYMVLLGLTLVLSPLSAQTVDVHTHIIIPEYMEVLKVHGAELEETFPLPVWEAERHLAFMDSVGIRTAVLTMPAPQPYYGDVEESAKCIRRVNEVSAEVKRQYPGRFKFCAALPLPDVDAAIREAVYALDTLKADGVKLATNSRGQYLGDEELDPLMEVLNERHAVVIIHPHRPTPCSEEIISTTPLAMYEYPAETTRAVVNMLARNVLVRYPNLKVVVPHCGSFLPLALPRMKSILQAMVKQGYMQPIDWEGNLSRLYFDLAGSPTIEVLRSLLTITTPDHLLYGSDYPYQPAAHLAETLQHLRESLAADETMAPYADAILYENAAKLFAADTVEVGKYIDKHPGMCAKQPMQPDGIVRLSKIEVYPQYIEEYIKSAIEVGEISLRTEPGVLTMYPLAEKDNPCMITILETYASQEAYRRHIASPHFQKYKQGTLHMVKTLVLTDQCQLNPSNQIKNYIQ